MNTEVIIEALKHVSIVGIVGRPGSGKEYTGDQLLAGRPGYCRIIMSDLIHEEINRGTASGMIMKQHIDSGTLVPDADVTNLFLNKVAILYSEGFKIIISDGFPRNPNQQDILHKHGARFSMFFIELPVENAIIRMLYRKRAGETLDICKARQNVFETETRPMIDRYRQQFPDSFREINGLLEAAHRARLVHMNVIQLGHILAAHMG